MTNVTMKRKMKKKLTMTRISIIAKISNFTTRKNNLKIVQITDNLKSSSSKAKCRLRTKNLRASP